MIKALNVPIPSKNVLVFFAWFFVAVVVFFLCFGFGLGIWGWGVGCKNTSHEIYILNIL